MVAQDLVDLQVLVDQLVLQGLADQVEHQVQRVLQVLLEHQE